MSFGRGLEVIQALIGVQNLNRVFSPVVAYHSPAVDAVGYVEELLFKIVEVPYGVGNPEYEIDISSLLLKIDGNIWISNGYPNSYYCSIALREIGSASKIDLVIYPNEDLGQGLHEVFLAVRDENASLLEYSFSFTQSGFYGVVEDEQNLAEVNLGPRCWDFKLNQVCPHRIVNELCFVDGDMQTVRLNRNVVSKSELKVLVNGGEVQEGEDFVLQIDELSVQPMQKHKLVFFKSFKSESDMVEVTYVTDVSTCPRCHALGYVDDFVVESSGVPRKIQGMEKLVQEAMKILTTSLRSNFYYGWYGTTLVESVGEKSSTLTSVKETQIKIQVSDAMKVLRDMQFQTRNMLRLRDDELLNRVLSVNVETSEADPTAFFVLIEVETRSGMVSELRLGVNNYTFYPRVV